MKKKTFRLSFQILLLVIIVLISGVLMLKNGTIDISAFFNKQETETNSKNNEVLLEKEVMNKQAIILASKTNVYSDKEQDQVIGTLPFSTDIFVTAEYGDLYEIKYKDELSYINKQDVELMDVNSIASEEVNMDDLMVTFPENFKNSYELFFAQFGESTDVIKSNLGNILGEPTNNNGNITLEYSDYHVSILFNDRGQAETIMINNIMINQSFQQMLSEKAQIKSKDQSLYYLKTDGYKYIFDLSKKMVTVTLSKPGTMESYLNIARTIYKLKNGENVKIIGYGDSITWGYTPFTGKQTSRTYLGELKDQLRSLYSNTQITTINRGTPGWQTDEGLASFGEQVLSQNPDLVIIMFGINDVRGSKYGPSIPIESYKNNLLDMAIKAKQAGIDVLLLSPTPILDTRNNNNTRILEYVKGVNEVAGTSKTHYIDLNSKINEIFSNKQEVPKDLLPDNIHFKADKYALIAHLIIDSFNIVR